MTRLRTDQACLDAQVRSQVEQKLNAELAGERRDTERCPPPSEGAFRRDLHAMIEAGLAQESLTRAAAREFYESMAASVATGIQATPWLETVRDPEPSKLYAWLGEGSSVRCPICDAEPGAKCRTPLTGPLSHAHWLRAQAEAAKTPTAPDCAPAIAPEAVNGGVAPSRGDSGRPVCACGQTVWRDSLDFDGTPICGDCSGDEARECWGGGKPASLDKRIAETKSDDATECAWSTPTSEGEGWT